MPKVKLIPSTYASSNASVGNINNMYTDVDSDTYGSFHTWEDVSVGYIYLRGFDFSLVPDNANIVSFVCRIKIKTGSPACSVVLKKISSSSVALCDAVTVSHDGQIHTIELYPSVSFETIKNYPNYVNRNPFAFWIEGAGNSSDHYIYGVEIEVTYNFDINKIIYSNKKLIDITSVSVTPEKVVEGYTFHLANGESTTGSKSTNPLLPKLTASSSSRTNRTLTFTNLEKEPSWFLAVCTSGSVRSYKALNILYNGSETYVRFLSNGSSTTIVSNNAEYVSFTYANAILKIVLNSTPYFGVSQWALYYM